MANAPSIPATTLGTAGTDATPPAEPVKPAIEVRDVTKVYGSRTILNKINRDVLEGETLVIMGGSGSGKSTLLRLMIGNVTPDGGDIIGLGRNICAMDEAELAQYRKSIGVLFQS